MSTDSSANVAAGDRLDRACPSPGAVPLDAEIIEVLGDRRAVPRPLGVRRSREHHLPGSDVSIEHFPRHRGA